MLSKRGHGEGVVKNVEKKGQGEGEGVVKNVKERGWLKMF